MTWIRTMAIVAACTVAAGCGSTDKTGDSAAPTDTTTDGSPIDTDTVCDNTATCDAYCADILSICTDTNAQFADDAECQTACAAYAADGCDGDVDGDTLQCRIYHLGAAEDDADTHCGHSGASGDGVCI